MILDYLIGMFISLARNRGSVLGSVPGKRECHTTSVTETSDEGHLVVKLCCISG